MVVQNLSLQYDTYGLSIGTSNLCKLEKNRRKGLRLHRPGLHVEEIC